MTKLKNSNCDKTQNVTKLKNSNCVKTKNKLNVLTLEDSNCEKTKKSNFEKTKKNQVTVTEVINTFFCCKNNFTPQQPMRCCQGHFL